MSSVCEFFSLDLVLNINNKLIVSINQKEYDIYVVMYVICKIHVNFDNVIDLSNIIEYYMNDCINKYKNKHPESNESLKHYDHVNYNSMFNNLEWKKLHSITWVYDI